MAEIAAFTPGKYTIGQRCHYSGFVWEARRTFIAAAYPKSNTYWLMIGVYNPVPVIDYEKIWNTQITVNATLPKPPYLIKDMIAYILMQEENGPVTPDPVNVAPTANAGTDAVITLPFNSVSLIGMDSDTDGTIVSRIWSQSSGPVLQSFTNTNTANASAVFNQSGTYVFTYTVTDDKGAIASDTLTVTVNPALAVNQAPTANAGPDNAITLPVNSTQLNGVATDSDGIIASYNWAQTIGPNTAAISNINIPNPVVSGLIEGTYTFALTATDDDGLTHTDTVIVTVKPEPIPGSGIDLPAPETTTAPTGLTLPGSSETPPDVYADNSPPLALDVRIANLYFNRAGEKLKLAFTYFDAENSAPGTHLYKWFRISKTGTIAQISGATGIEYLLTAADIGYGIAGEITPVSSDGQIGIPVRTMRTDYVVSAEPVYPKAALTMTGVSGVITGTDSVIRSSSAADGKAHTVKGFTGKGYVQFKNALPGSYSGFGGGKKNSGNYGITFGMEFSGQFFDNKFEAWETGGRTHAEFGPVYAGAYIRVIRDLNTDANGNPMPGTWAIYYAYCPFPNGVFRRFKKSSQAINGTTPIGLDFLINNPYAAGQGFNGLEIAGEQIVNM